MSITSLIPYAHVADVQRSADFYRRLGLEEVNRYENEGKLLWVFMVRDEPAPGARVMLALADEPVDPGAQAVLFYGWSEDVVALREELRQAGIETSDIHHPFYMPAGEFSVCDPDGYMLLIGQLGEPE